MIVSLLVFVTIVVLAVPTALVLFPFTLLSGNVGPLYAAGSWIARTAMFVAGIRVRIEGREHVPAGRACIFMANHVSNLDPPGLIPRIPGRTSAFAKKSLFKMPVFGYCLKLAEYIPVDRSRSVSGAQESVAAARRILAEGIHITTFVEGTRSKDGRMLPFKKGPFYLAMETGAPCIPISIYGTETLLAKGSLAIKPGTVHFIFHPPIDPANFACREDLMQAVRASIASGLPEWMRT